MRRSVKDRNPWAGRRRARWRRQGAAAPELLESRAMLATDLDALQVAALRRGVEVFAEQIAAVQLTGPLSEIAVGVAQPIGTILSVGDELRRGLSEPLARRLTEAMNSDAVVTAFSAAAAADDAAGNFLRLGSITQRVIDDPGRRTLWFEVPIDASRLMPAFMLDVGQRPSDIAGQQTLYDRGLRLTPLEVDVTAGVSGTVRFGIDLAAGLPAEQAVRIDVDALRVFARANQTGAAALKQTDAAFGALRLGPADVDVAFDLAAEISLAGNQSRQLGQLLSEPAPAHFDVRSAAGSFGVGIPFTLGVGGFAETGARLKLDIGASASFHEATQLAALEMHLLRDVDPGPADDWRPVTLTTDGQPLTSPGTFGLEPFGGITASDLGGWLVEADRLAPSLLGSLEIPLVGATFDDTFDTAGRVRGLVDALRGPDGQFTFDTADGMIDAMGRFFGSEAAPLARSAFDLRWNPAAQGLQFRIPLDFSAQKDMVFDAATLRPAVPAGLPVSVTGRGTASIDVDAGSAAAGGGLALVGGVTRAGAAGLPDRTVTTASRFADVLGQLGAGDLLPTAAEFTIELRDGTKVPVELGGVLPGWVGAGNTTVGAVVAFLDKLSAKLGVALVDGHVVLTDRSSGPNPFRVVPGEETTVTPSNVVGGTPLETQRLSLAAVKLGLSVAPTDGATLDGSPLGTPSIRDRIYFTAASTGAATITLQADVRAGVSIGTLGIQTHPLDGDARAIRSVVTVTPAIGTAADAADGRITVEELARSGVSLVVTPVEQAGVVQFDLPEAVVGQLGVDPTRYSAAPLSHLADFQPTFAVPQPPAFSTVPYVFLAPAAAGSWRFDVQPSQKLQELLSGIATLSPTDLKGMFAMALDRLEQLPFWKVDFPGLGLSLDDILGFRRALDAIGGLDVATLGRPTFDDAGVPTWPAASFGSVAKTFLDGFTARRAELAAALPPDRLRRVESLTWVLEGLVDEVGNWTAGDPTVDIDLIGRITNWGRAATAEVGSLPVEFDGLRASLAGLTGFLDGLHFGLDSFRGRLESAFTQGLAAAAGGAGLPTIHVTPLPAVAGAATRMLFDVRIDVGTVSRVFDFSAVDVSVGGVALPLVIEGQGDLRLSLGGTVSTRIGWDFATHAPILDPGSTVVDITASIGSSAATAPTGGGFVLSASLGGLADISVGGTKTGQRMASVTLSAALGSVAPAHFGLTAAGEISADAHFAADLPLYATTLADRGLGTAMFDATFSLPSGQPASPASFDLNVRFDPAFDDLAQLLAGMNFNTLQWRELICGFMTSLTNDVVAAGLRKLPFVGGVDFSQITFFTDVCGWLEGLNFSSPAALRASLPGDGATTYAPNTSGSFASTTGPVADPTTSFTCTGGGGTTRGLRILDAQGNPKASVAAWDGSGGLRLDDSVVIDLTVTGTRTITIAAGGLDIGLPALGITANASAKLDLGFTLQIGLGYSKAGGFFIETQGTVENPVPELAVTADLRLDDAAIVAGLGPVKFVARDIRSDAELHAELAADLGAARRVDVTDLPGVLAGASLSGGVKAGLDLDLSADLFDTGNNGTNGKAVGLGATLHMGFASGGQADGAPVPLADVAANLYFEISDIGLDFGGLLSGPIQRLMDRITAALKPVKGTIDLLTSEVPLISDLSKRLGQGAVTFLTLVKAYDAEKGAQAEQFITTVSDVVTVADTLSALGASGRLSLGSLSPKNLQSLLGSTPLTAGGFDSAGAGGLEAGETKDTLDGIRGIGGSGNQIAFPILDNPLESAFGILFGKDVSLVTWDIPDLVDVGFGFDQSFPIFPPLFARIFGSVGFGTDLSVGYDTRGIRQALAGGGDGIRPAKVVNGIYFDDVHGGVDSAEVSLTATLGAGAEVSAVVAKAGAEGGVRGTIGANFRDPNGDGKVHLDEFKRLYDQSPECVFDFEGSLDAFFAAYLKLGFDTPLGFVTLFSAGMDLLDIRLFDWAAKTCPDNPPALASIVDWNEIALSDAELGPPHFDRQAVLFGAGGRGKGLALHMGAWAGVDGVEDDAEEFEVVQAIDPVTKLPMVDTDGHHFVVVKARGLESKPFNEKDFDFIWFDGRKYQDIVTIAPEITKPVLGHGGEGNDRITGGSGKNYLFGDDGRDRVLGRGGDDELHGGGGDDLVLGFGGADTLFGDEGADQLYGEDETGDMVEFKKKNPGYLAGKSGNDTIDGGGDGDTIFGGDGDDRLLGEENIDARGGDDTIFGGKGDDTLIGQQGNDQLFGNAGNDTLWGDDEAGQTPLGGGNSDLLEGGPGANFLWGGADRDYLYAFSRDVGADASGDEVRDFSAVLDSMGFVADVGVPVYDVTSGSWSRSKPTAVFKYASFLEGGADADVLVGTKGADRLSGGFEMDEITGGLGDDLLIGGPGSDWIVAAGGNAAIFGGDGDDVIEGGAGVNWIEGGPGDDEIYAGLGADTVFGGTTAAGYEAFIKPFMERTRSAANSEPGRPVIQALHGGYRTRPTQDPERSACEPDVFVHPEVYPDSPYTISVQIFEDLDGDGVRDEGEGDANWNKPWTIDVEDLRDDPYQRVIVPGARSTGGTTVMPAGSGLPEGSYRVTVVTDDPAVWRIHGGAAAFTIDVTLDAAHPQITLPVGFYRQARVAGRVEREQPQGDPTPMAGVSVYLDANESGSYDAGERTDRTDAEGRYQFKGLEPGTQHVRVALDPGRLTAFPEVRNFRLQSGQLADNKNFVVSANVATVSGRVFRAQPNAQPAVAMAGVTVFLDVVGNGRVDPGEPTAITDASGRYAFPDLSFGSYTIQVDIDIDNVTSAPRTRAVNLFEAVDVVDQDFLIDSKGLSAFTALFAAIVENDPPVATPSADSSFAAQSFGDLPVIAFGDSFVQPSGGTIMGSVWRHDPEAQNGLTPDLIQGRGEPGIADQLISLFRLDGAFETLVATTRSSNLDASFQFTGLAAGTYVVRQTPTKKFQQVTGGGATKSETLYAVTNRAAAPANDRSTLWQVGTAPFAVGEVASFTEFVARDVAVVDHATAFIVGTATAGGSPGLWRYDIAADRLTSLGYDFPELGPLVALDVLDNSRLLGLTDKGMLVTYTPDVNLWQQVGRLQTGAAGTTQAVYPVGDLTVVSPREVSFVGMAGTLPDLTNMSFPIPAREQAIYRVDTTTVSAGLVLTAERAGDLQLPAPPKDELLEYLPGLDRTAAGRLFALGSLGGVYTAAGVGNGAAIAFNEIGRIFPLPDSLGADLATFGGLAIAPYELVPDSARTDFLITITDREVVTVGFGNRQLDERLIDGGDVIDAGCDASGDVVFGDDGFNLPAEFADFALPDDLYHEGGHDTIRGRGGDDTIDGGLAGDTIDGGDGADTIHGGREALNWIVGGQGDDEITGGDAMDVIYGNDGDDSIAGEAGNDLLFGGAGADLLDGGVDDDLLVAGAGGGTKGQKVFGGLGDDTIVVRDVTLGGEFAVAPTGVQADTYRGDGGTDTLVLDTSTLAAVDDVVFVSLSDAELTAYGVDVALGLEIARLTGGAGDNIFTAATFSGRAVLSGLAGKDELTGGSGDDQIAGGTGTNRLTGGLGNDTFTVVLDSVNTIVEAIAGGSDRVDASAVGTVALDVLVGSVADGVVVRSLSVVPAAGLDVSFASGGIETLVLGAGDDRLTIKDNASTAAAILAGPGTNRLYYDDIFGGWGAWAGAVNVDLVAGTATGTAGIEGFRDVYGGDGGDTLRGDAGDNVLVGGGGNDTILGGSGDDMLSAGAGLNSLAGNADDDTYYFSDLGQTDTVVELPGQGYDEIFVLSGVAGGTFDVGNSIVATVGGGRMTSIFAAGIDRVRGTALADRFRIADGTAFAGILDGGGMPGYEFADFDTLDYTGWTAPVTVDFTGQIDATVRGSATGTGGVVNLRHVVGGSRNDSLTAGGLPVWFEGGAGDDTLTGSGQNDLLAGGSGGDTLVGGYGDDRYAFADHYGADSVTEPIFAGGSDTMDFSAVTAALEVRLGSVTVTTPGEAGNSAVHAAHAIETVVGGAANDTFVMTGAGVTFPGTLDGGAGSNTLRYDDATVAIKAAVRAGGTPNVGTARNFTTVIAELNLFAPVFVGGFTGAVQENAPVTTVAFLARATDADDAPGNAITYSLKPALADDAALVTIDPVKGEVRLASPANYESKNAYRFTVIATDAGYPSRSTEQAVTVNVLNVVEPRTAPRIAAPTGFFLTEDTPDGLRFTGTPFSDADSPAATLMTVTLRVASGSIAAANGGGVVVGGTPAARTFTGTLASLNAYFTGEPARIVYTPALDASGIRLLGITIAEGPVSQRLSSTVNAPISIAAVNDAPKVKAPLSFLVTEDVASPLTWPAAIVPFSDVDSASLTVTLSVGAGSLTAASTAAVRVGGEPGARTFTGSSAALSAYFQQLGRVRYTSALDDTVQRTLTVTATDGQLTSATTAKINITPVNDRPTLAAAAVTLAGGVTGRPYEITYEQLKTATGPADVDSPAVSFVVEAVAAGTVQKWNGLRWVAVAPAGAIAQRRLDPGQKIQWIPPLGATGTRRAFTIRAYDGQASSTGTAIVSVTLG